MSDFLSNLIDRARGALEVVQPHIPSIYEPYRRGSGLLGAHPGFAAPDASSELAVEAASEGDAYAAPISHQARDLEARRVLPGRNDQTEPAVETGSEGDASATSINHGTHRLRTRLVRATPPESHAKLGARFKPPDSSRVVRPHFIPRVAASPEQIAAIDIPNRHDGATELRSSPLVRRTFQPSLQTAKATDPIAVPPADASADEPESACSLPAAPAVREGGLVGRLRSPEIDTETSSASLDFRRFTEPRASAEPALVAKVLSSATGALPPVEWPSLQARPAPSVTGAVRPPLAPRSRGVNQPEAGPSSGSLTPAVQVSIGKVEVRAAFAEPRNRLAPPPRSMPTVSLDDYLNRRHRGNR